MEFLVLEPKAIDLADIAGGHEGLDVLALEIFHEVGEFLLGKKGLNLIAFFAGVAADDLIEAAAAAKLVDDEAADLLVVMRDDADPLALVQAGREIVHDKAVDPCADEADDHHPERIDGESCAADDSARHGHGRPDVEVKVLVDNLCEYVKAAG